MRRRSFLALTAVVLLASGPAGIASRAEVPGFAGAFRWVANEADFGGFSAIEVAPDGTAFTALTDRGTLVTGQLRRNGDGRITGVDAVASVALKMPDGPVPEGFRFDTEGLAAGDDGSLLVSTEFVTRVMRYGAAEDAPVVLPVPRDFVGMSQNGGPEALAVAVDGTVYTLPEETRRPDGATPVFRFRDGAWDQPFRFAGDPAFLPVGADIGPDGQLYILERQFRGLGGFASRLRRMPLDGTGSVDTETLLETAPGTFGNLEGIAIWRGPGGDLRATMISDDNFLAVLGTEIVEVRLPG